MRFRAWYRLIRFGTVDEIMAGLQDPEKRAVYVAEASALGALWPRIKLRQVNTDANQFLVGKTLGQIAEIRGCTPVDAMIDISIEENLDAHFLSENMGHNDDAEVGRLLNHPRVHIGASDGGAHILSFSTYGDTGYLLGHFVRDKALLGLEQAIKKITSDTASIWGIAERGLLQPGYIADIAIFDSATIDRGAEYFTPDVPGDGSRYVRDAIGMDTVLVGGAVAWSAADGYSASTRGKVLPGARR
jgi:N-acyl-D-aspartate/D-glutamate deacylase